MKSDLSINEICECIAHIAAEATGLVGHYEIDPEYEVPTLLAAAAKLRELEAENARLREAVRRAHGWVISTKVNGASECSCEFCEVK